LERIIKDPEKMVNMLTSVEQGNGWARGAVTATGSYDWLKNMPIEQRTTLPDGTRLLGVHPSLVSDELVVMKDTIVHDKTNNLLKFKDVLKWKDIVEN
jgi:hypothetical protein